MTLAQDDALRPVLDSVFRAPEYQWVEPVDPLRFLKQTLAQIVDWLRHMETNSPLLYQAILFALVAVLVILIAHVSWIVYRTLRAPPTATAAEASAPLRRDQRWYRDEAARHAAAGRFADAMQADFLALILVLDARGVLRFHPSKTPGEYLAEVALSSHERDNFREVVAQLYRHLFAGDPCGAEDYATWRHHTAQDQYAPAQ